ncbi:MAG: DUF3311 domain-containing protein [Gammaproteobacteria bacterium]
MIRPVPSGWRRLAAIALSLIAPIAILGGPFFVNRVHPWVVGLPFLLFWILLWTVLASMLTGIAYWIERGVRV